MHRGHILPGDEIVQVDEQVVVSWGRGHVGILVWLGRTPVQLELRGACLWLGRIWGMQELRCRGWAVPLLTRCPWQVGWTRVNLVKKLLEKASRASLVLKKLPLSLPGSPLSTRQQVSIPSTSSARKGCAGTQPGVYSPMGGHPRMWQCKVKH